MKNLTATQSEIIKNIEAEFLKINETNTSTDILSQIDNAINEKRILREQLLISDKAYRKSIEIIKDEIIATLQQIADKYSFTLKCEKKYYHSDYDITLIFNGYYNKEYPTSELNAKASICMPISSKEGIVHLDKPVPNYRGYTNIMDRYANKEEFIQFFVNETIKILKSKI